MHQIDSLGAIHSRERCRSLAEVSAPGKLVRRIRDIYRHLITRIMQDCKETYKTNTVEISRKPALLLWYTDRQMCQLLLLVHYWECSKQLSAQMNRVNCTVALYRGVTDVSLVASDTIPWTHVPAITQTHDHVMSCHVMSCHFMSCHVMSCHVCM